MLLKSLRTAEGRETLQARVYEPVLGRLLADMRAQVLTMCRHMGAQRVLDVCCGPAGVSRVLRQGGLQVCSLDLSWPMLRQGQVNTAAPASGLAPATGLGFVLADAAQIPFVTVNASPSSFDASVLVLGLHALSPLCIPAVVREMLRVAPCAIIADFRLAERNCDILAVALAHGVEWLVGGEHYANYKVFMAAGGIEGLVSRTPAMPCARVRTLGGAASVIALKASA